MKKRVPKKKESLRTRVLRTVLGQMTKAGMSTQRRDLVHIIVTAVAKDHLSATQLAKVMRVMWHSIGVPNGQTYDEWAEELYQVLEKKGGKK